MKFLPLLWAGVWRKPARAVLMLLQIVSAFTLFGLLEGVNAGVRKNVEEAHADRLYVMSSVGGRDPLPISLLDRVRSTPGVQYVTPRVIFPGFYQKPNQNVPIVGVEADAHFAIIDEMKASKQAIEALRATRTGAIVGRLTLEKYGLKVGERVVFQSPLPRTDGSKDWAFDIVGEFEFTDRPQNSIIVLANYAYVNESRLVNRNTTDMFVVKIDDPAESGGVTLAIDNQFANSPYETHTQSEADSVMTGMQRLMDLDYMVTAIIAAVFFALLLATGALMMQSIRERTPELAVLKTLGFRDGQVMALILAEGVVLCLCAAAIGLVLAHFLMPLARMQVSQATVSGTVIGLAAVFAVFLALLGGSIPALRGLRLQVVDALAGR
jgi:putative ABC transport system permease protein